MKDEYQILKSLLIRDRSIRRFDNAKRINEETLTELVSLTHYCASGRNLQPLKYRIVYTGEECEKVYPYLKWAGYLPDWDGPDPGERPVAYLIQCLDTRLTTSLLCDDGLQLQAITLGATAKGLGCCIIKSFNVEAISKGLSLPQYCKPLYILALGFPVEQVEIEITKETPGESDIRYYRTSDGVHHVPKRPLQELIIK